jgi:predicted DCC family thiol-disulfide oxidoreductase YuxK
MRSSAGRRRRGTDVAVAEADGVGRPGAAVKHGSLDHAIVLFDGTCAFCEGAVKFIARRDPDGYFRFGASQTPAAAAILADHGLSRESARSLVLVEGGAVYLRSTASLGIARRLVWPWPILAAFLVLPAPLRDLFYRVVAAIRHRVAGPSKACEIPPAELRDRLI